MALNLLSDAALRTIKPTNKDQLISDGSGLYLLVKPDGKKWWRFIYTFDGKRKALSLGVYPQISLSVARRQAESNRESLANGLNPSELRKQDKANQKAKKIVEQQIIDGIAPTGSFEHVALEWFDKKMNIRSASHQKRTMALLKRDLFPWIGKRPIAEITPAELLKPLERIENRNAIETAHRALQTAGQVFRYAWSKDMVSQDITQALRGALASRKGGNFSAITDPQLVKPLMQAISNYSGTFVVKTALRLAPLVFVRPSELRTAEWSQIDFEARQWRYLITKTQTEHIVPLSNQVIEILREIQPLTGKGRYVFPSARTPNGSRPMSDMALLTALRSLGFGKEEMTVHGFRAMARTILDEVLGYRPEFIEHQLGHAVKDANGRAYNRTSHLPERRKMMQAWADYLDNLKAGATVLSNSVEKFPVKSVE
jgi:integrase